MRTHKIPPLLSSKSKQNLTAKTSVLNYDAGYILKQLKLAELSHVPILEKPKVVCAPDELQLLINQTKKQLKIASYQIELMDSRNKHLVLRHSEATDLELMDGLPVYLMINLPDAMPGQQIILDFPLKI